MKCRERSLKFNEVRKQAFRDAAMDMESRIPSQRVNDGGDDERIGPSREQRSRRRGEAKPKPLRRPGILDESRSELDLIIRNVDR